MSTTTEQPQLRTPERTGAETGPHAGPAPTVAAQSMQHLPRVLGALRGECRGSTLIVVAGLHGNEPAGVEASLRLLAKLGEREQRLSGEVVVLVGNRCALAKRRRFLARDLNRAWTDQKVAALRGVDPAGLSDEDLEQYELLHEIEAITARARGFVHVLDMHTFSAHGCAFTTVSDSLHNRAFATAIRAPLILGLEELVEGTLLSYLNHLGYITAGFESGQHEDPEAVDLAEAGLWVATVAAGTLAPEDAPEAEAARERLGAELRHLPPVLEMRHRHPVLRGDRFRMRPGFENLQEVAAGTVLADDRHGEVVAPMTARMLMPLYQEQGDDGFFLVGVVRWFWLHLSALARRLGARHVLPLLPGVQRHPVLEHAMVVNRRVARWYALDLCHLLGYRRPAGFENTEGEAGDQLVVVQRRQRPRRFGT